MSNSARGVDDCVTRKRTNSEPSGAQRRTDERTTRVDRRARTRAECSRAVASTSPCFASEARHSGTFPKCASVKNRKVNFSSRSGIVRTRPEPEQLASGSRQIAATERDDSLQY